MCWYKHQGLFQTGFQSDKGVPLVGHRASAAKTWSWMGFFYTEITKQLVVALLLRIVSLILNLVYCKWLIKKWGQSGRTWKVGKDVYINTVAYIGHHWASQLECKHPTKCQSSVSINQCIVSVFTLLTLTGGFQQLCKRVNVRSAVGSVRNCGRQSLVENCQRFWEPLL